MMSKSFKPGKCKTSLKLAISRIRLLKNRRDIQVKQLRRELAQLLETGQEQTARIRVEHVIREEKTMSAYDLIEIYCELIVARMPIIESQKSCPIDLKEAISSVIFSSPRCADIPELTDARKQFVAKYGKEFVTSALELRPDCGVNRMIVEKLSAKTPDTETKMKILIAIAKEHEIKWDSKALEELQKPEDPLNSSSSFTGANKMAMDPLNVKFSPNTSQTESASNVYQTDVSSKPTSFDSSSQANLRTTPLVPPLAPNEFRESDGKAGVLEVKDSYPREEAAFFKQPTWRMEFKDAASAAQVAAESAERASIAARAAAELASLGNISRQNTFDPNGSSLHGSGDKRPKRAVSSKLKGKINEFVNMDHDKVKGFQGMKEEVHKLPRDELREEISHHSSTSDEGMEFSSQMDNVRKFDSFRRSFSRMETGNKKKHDEAGFIEKNVEVNYDRSASASSISTFDDDTIWIPPIDKHQPGNHDNLGHNIYEIDAGERLFRYDSKEHVSSDYPAAVFDEYDPEPADDKENLFDSFNKKRNDQLPFAPSTSSINSIIFSSSHHESHPVSVEKIPLSKFDDSLSVAFDDSDGHTSESDDDMSSFRQNGTTQNSSLQHEESDLGGDSHPREELQPSSSTKAKPLLGAEEKNHLQVSSPSVGAKDPEMPDELAGGGNFGLKFGRLTGGLRNRGYSHPSYTENSVVDSPVSSLETLGSTISSTNQIFSPRDKPFRSSLIEDDSLNPIMTGASTNLESEKAKGSLPEEYNKGSRSNKTFSTDRSEEDGDATGFSVKQSVSNQEKSRRYRGGDPNPSKNVPFDPSTNASEFSTVSEVINQKIYYDKPRTKAYKELSSRMSMTDFDSDGDAEERDSQVNMENQGNASSNTTFKFSRRTKDFTLKGRPNLPRSTGYSVMSNSETESQATRRSSASELPSQTVDKVTVVQGKHNRKSSNPNSSAESMPEFLVHEENKESTEGIPDPATTIINSGTSKPSDSGGGTKLLEAAYQKVSHVHPKLPDYETFASHFQSLRSNRRQL